MTKIGCLQIISKKEDSVDLPKTKSVSISTVL